jgi:hypothetical protein
MVRRYRQQYRVRKIPFWDPNNIIDCRIVVTLTCGRRIGRVRESADLSGWSLILRYFFCQYIDIDLFLIDAIDQIHRIALTRSTNNREMP